MLKEEEEEKKKKKKKKKKKLFQPDKWTDRYDEANSCFLQVCEKQLKM
jgi:hypothetical protein